MERLRLFVLVMVCIACFPARAPAQLAFQFAAPRNFAAGYLDFEAVADLDGDLNLDVVAGGSGNFFIFRGDGTGGFGAPESFADGFIYSCVALSDLDGDGCLDLSVIDTSLSQLHLYLATNCNYQTRISHSVPGATLSVSSADFNEDGHPDHAVTSWSGGTVTVFLGDGAGGLLVAPVSYGVAGEPYSIATGDLDGDGHMDLAVACRTAKRVAILWGMGDGRFSAPVYRRACFDARFVSLGDLNNDGKLDLVVAGFDSRQLTVLTQKSKRRFKSKTYAAGSGPIAAAIGDLNCDALPDIVTANYYDSAVLLFAGKPKGKFVQFGGLLVGGPPYGVRVGDFNNDGLPDILSANFSGGNSLTLLLNQCSSAP